MEPADQDLHPVGEFDRDRVQPHGRRAGQAEDDDPVDPVQGVEGQLGRHRRQPEADHAPEQPAVDPEAEPSPLDPQPPEHEDDAGAEVAEQDRLGTQIGPHQQGDRDRDRDHHRRHGEAEVLAGPFVQPQERQRVLPKGELPKPHDHQAREVGLGAPVQQKLGDRAGQGKGHQRHGGRRPEQRREPGAHHRRRLFAGEVVEAQDRLDHSESYDDRGGDEGRDHDLDVAVLRRAQVRRVDRQQEDRDQLR